MGIEIKQNADGSGGLFDDAGGQMVLRTGGAGYRSASTACIKLTGGTDTAGAIGSWLNPQAGAIIVTEVAVDVVTASSAACSVSVGSAASATTLGANLLDTQSVAAIAVLDNVTNKGTNGKTSLKVAAGSYITVSTASGASAGLVGVAYITYFPIATGV